MGLVICHCKQCRNTIGKFINRWYEFDIYTVPIIESRNDLEVCQRSTVNGEPSTLMEGCRLQIIACVNCSAFLGLKCVETPVNHVLYRNQILFYDGSVALSNDTGKKVFFHIDRTLNYTEPSRASTVDSVETQGESDTPHRRGVINIALPENELASQASNEMTKVGNQVQQELADLRSQVSDLHNQVDILTSKANNRVSATNDGNEVATLRAENADLRRLLSNMRSNHNPERSFPSKELDILTNNIAKIGNRAGQVESLQMEFDILKGRVERLEGDQQTAKNFISPNCRKRTSSEAGLPETDLAARLPVVSARSSLSAHLHQLSTHRQTVSLEAAGPEGALLERGHSRHPSLSGVSSKDGEPSRGERN